MTIKEAKEQTQQDILSVLDGWEIGSLMSTKEYEKLKNALYDVVINNLDKIKEL
jgi:PHD/YefM family antitoxin component YafN of YafNO toxin-antitoxin module